MRAGISIFFLIIASLCFGQDPKAGDLAPEVTLEKVVSPASAPVPTLAGLKGKVVVMEFWGVWCGHCVENIPHLNQLAEKYDVNAEGAPNDTRTLPALQLALSSALGISATRDEREIDAYVLAQVPGQAHKLEKPGPERATAGSNRNSISVTNETLTWLVMALDGRAGVPVVDETGLSDKFTYDLTFSATAFETLRKAVRDQLGLDLRKEKRKLPVVVIRKAG